FQLRSRHFLCNGAQTLGKEWETVGVSGLPRTKTKNPKQEGKSYYEKQKKYPDLHRRHVLDRRDLGEFIAGRASAPAPASFGIGAGCGIVKQRRTAERVLDCCRQPQHRTLLSHGVAAAHRQGSRSRGMGRVQS